MQTCGVIGREFCAAGKRAEVVVQRHPTILDVLLGVGELVLNLVLVEQHCNVVGGEDLDPLGDGMFHGRALTIWADLSQVRWSRAVIATVILGQAWGAHHRGRVGVTLTSRT